MSSFQSKFALSQSAVRIRFAPGIRHDTGSEVARLDCARAAILSTPGKRNMAEALASDMGGLAAGLVPLA
ncbi:hypothetical protein [Roseovarius sp. Pro17]|uniref:hypothetical protein n=1 Tax=Roseovarius sp. Pro17 TaxID=3108175 RepID=UPI002D76BAD5|nr:hypothetical protein [Roseovarius sp. Pro17]